VDVARRCTRRVDDHLRSLGDLKVRRFVPHNNVDQRSLHRGQWFRDDQYVFRQMVEQAKKILDNEQQQFAPFK